MPAFNDFAQAGPSRAGSSTRHSSAPKKGHGGQCVTDEQWRKTVESFLQAVENSNDSAGIIRPAWKKLRQNYAQKFQATIAHPSSSSASLEPFSLWAAETFEEDILNRVLRVEFSHQLTQFNHLSLLRSTAAMADISMWHMILYFGTSIFSELRIKAVRKRTQMFTIDPSGTAWPFTEAYQLMLRQTAVKQRSALNSTIIPCSDTPPLFTSRELFTLAPSNPEFQLAPQAKIKSNKTMIIGIPFRTTEGWEGKEDQGEKREKGDRKAKGKGKERQIGWAGHGERGQSLNHVYYSGLGHGLGQGGQSPDGLKDQEDLRQELTYESQPLGHATWASARGKSTLIPPACPSTSQKQQAPGLSNTLVPSVEAPDPIEQVGQGPSRNLKAPTSVDTVDDKVNPQESCRLSRAQKLDRKLAKRVAGQRMDFVHTTNVFRFGRAASLNLTAAGTPFPLKRLSKEERDDAGPSKRPQLEQNRPAAAAAGTHHISVGALSQEWTDRMIFEILKKLEAIRSEDFVVVDGMKACSAAPSALTTTDICKGTILLPLKVSDDHRILAVLRLNTINSNDPSVEKPKQGTILYYDPADSESGDFLRGYQLAARVAQLLGCILPSYDADPGSWEMQYCAMPKQQAKGNAGVALCLAAMCVVGCLPRMAQIPDEADWTFWRHFILGCFYGSDEFVRAQTDKYRSQTIQTLVCQGQVRGCILEYEYESDDEIQFLGQTTRDPFQRMIHIENNVQRLFQEVHHGHIICLDLMSHIDRGMASLKIKLDKSCLIHKKLEDNDYKVSGKAKTEPAIEEGLTLFQEEQGLAEFSFDQYRGRQLALDEAARHLRLAIEEATVWRNEIQQAVLNTNEGMA